MCKGISPLSQFTVKLIDERVSYLTSEIWSNMSLTPIQVENLKMEVQTLKRDWTEHT